MTSLPMFKEFHLSNGRMDIHVNKNSMNARMERIGAGNYKEKRNYGSAESTETFAF